MSSKRKQQAASGGGGASKPHGDDAAVVAPTRIAAHTTGRHRISSAAVAAVVAARAARPLRSKKVPTDELYDDIADEPEEKADEETEGKEEAAVARDPTEEDGADGEDGDWNSVPMPVKAKKPKTGPTNGSAGDSEPAVAGNGTQDDAGDADDDFFDPLTASPAKRIATVADLSPAKAATPAPVAPPAPTPALTMPALEGTQLNQMPPPRAKRPAGAGMAPAVQSPSPSVSSSSLSSLTATTPSTVAVPIVAASSSSSSSSSSSAMSTAVTVVPSAVVASGPAGPVVIASPDDTSMPSERELADAVECYKSGAFGDFRHPYFEELKLDGLYLISNWDKDPNSLKAPQAGAQKPEVQSWHVRIKGKNVGYRGTYMMIHSSALGLGNWGQSGNRVNYPQQYLHLSELEIMFMLDASTLPKWLRPLKRAHESMQQFLCQLDLQFYMDVVKHEDVPIAKDWVKRIKSEYLSEKKAEIESRRRDELRDADSALKFGAIDEAKCKERKAFANTAYDHEIATLQLKASLSSASPIDQAVLKELAIRFRNKHGKPSWIAPGGQAAHRDRPLNAPDLVGTMFKTTHRRFRFLYKEEERKLAGAEPLQWKDREVRAYCLRAKADLEAKQRADHKEVSSGRFVMNEPGWHYLYDYNGDLPPTPWKEQALGTYAIVAPWIKVEVVIAGPPHNMIRLEHVWDRVDILFQGVPIGAPLPQIAYDHPPMTAARPPWSMLARMPPKALPPPTVSGARITEVGEGGATGRPLAIAYAAGSSSSSSGGGSGDEAGPIVDGMKVVI